MSKGILSAAASCLSNLTMPRLSLGTLDINGPEKVRSAIHGALDLGYKRIDCAPVYFNENFIGDALQEYFSSENNNIQREDIFLTSKLACPFHRKEYVEPALRKTLSDLRTDYIDLYLIHWPVSFFPLPKELNKDIRGYRTEDIDDSDGGNNIDPSVSIHETWESMEALVQKGLVRQIGVSNFPVPLLRELISKSKIPPSVNQVELHPFLQQPELLKYCEKRGLELQAYSPLGTPGYKEIHEPSIMSDPLLLDLASKYDISVAQLCIAWALQRGTSVVAKSESNAHQKENLMATTTLALKLTDEDMRKIASLDTGYRYFRPEDWWGNAGKALFN